MWPLLASTFVHQNLLPYGSVPFRIMRIWIDLLDIKVLWVALDFRIGFEISCRLVEGRFVINLVYFALLSCICDFFFLGVSLLDNMK